MISVVKSEKNKNVLNVDGYVFHKEKKYKNKTYWNCVEVDRLYCKVRAHTDENNIITKFSKFPHNHTANAANVETRTILSEMKKFAVKTGSALVSTQSIVADTCASVPQAVASEIPGPLSLKRTIQ